MNKLLRNKNGKYHLYIPILLTIFLPKLFLSVNIIIYNNLENISSFSKVDMSAKSSLTSLFSYIIFFFLCYLWLENKGQGFNEIMNMQKRKLNQENILKAIVIILSVYLVSMITNIIIMFLLEAFVPSNMTPKGTDKLTNTEVTKAYKNEMVWLVKYFAPIVMAPIGEELMYRGLTRKFFQTEGLYNIRSIAYIITTSVVFGFAHYNADLVGIPYMFAVLSPTVFGILLSVTYLKVKDLRITMTIHFLNNFLVMIIIPLILNKKG